MAHPEEAPFDTTGEILKEFLIANDIALVRFSYLKQLRVRGGALPRRQLIPPEELVQGDELRSLDLRDSTEKGGTKLFAVSHAWLSNEHPDPTGARTEELLYQVDLCSRGDPDCLLFMDFCSINQMDRRHPDCLKLKSGYKLRHGHPALLTPPQIKLVKNAMSSMDTIFASAVSNVIVLPVIHSLGSFSEAGYTAYRRDYIHRGWCHIEFVVAKMFGRVKNTQLKLVRSLLGQTFDDRPEVVEQRQLTGDLMFTEKSDKEPVLAMYRRCYATANKHELLELIRARRTKKEKDNIIAGLQALHWAVRKNYAQTLGEKKLSDYAPAIAVQLKDADIQVRVAARDALSRMRATKELTEGMTTKFEDNDPEVRIAALNELGKKGPMGLTQAQHAGQCLADKHVFVSKSAKDALSQMGFAGADGVATWLASRDAQTRDAAQEVMRELGPQGAVAAAAYLGTRIRTHVNGGPGDDLREFLRALAATGAPAAAHADAAAKHLNHRDASVRCAALEALLKMGAAGAEAVAEMLSDSNAESRGAAARTLEKFGEDGLVHAPEVARLLRDECWTVRQHAVHFLGAAGCGNVEAHAPLLQQLRDEDPDDDVRAEAASVLEGLTLAGLPGMVSFDGTLF